MKEYQFQWRYFSSLGTGDEGDILQLTQEQADAFNRDSPGVLKPHVPDEPAKVVAGRAMTGPPADRMVVPGTVSNRTVEATDAAAKLAKENGIDLATVTGTGAGGKVIKSDVEALIEVFRM